MYSDIKKALQEQASACVSAYAPAKYKSYLAENALRAGKTEYRNNNDAMIKKTIPAAACLAVVMIAAIIAFPSLRGSRPPAVDVPDADNMHIELGTNVTTEAAEMGNGEYIPRTEPPAPVISGIKQNAETPVSHGPYPDTAFETTEIDGSEFAVGSSAPTPTAALTTTQAIAWDTTNETTGVPALDRRSIVFQFGETEWEDRIYRFVSEEKATKNVAEKLGSLQIEGFDEQTGKKRLTGAQAYRFENIDPAWAIGISYDGYDGIWTFVCSDYTPATLGEMLSAIDFDNTVSVDGMQIRNDDQRKPADKELLKNTLFTDLTLSPAGDGFNRDIACVAVSCPSLGIENRTMMLTAEGYMYTDLLENCTGACRFFVGVDRMKEFLRAAGEENVDALFETVYTGALPLPTFSPFNP